MHTGQIPAPEEAHATFTGCEAVFSGAVLVGAGVAATAEPASHQGLVGEGDAVPGVLLEEFVDVTVDVEPL